MNFGQWLGFLSLLISLYILWQIRQLLLLVFTAVVIATALNRLVRRLQKIRVDRHLAIAITFSLSLLVVALFFWLILPPFIGQFQKLLQLSPAVGQRLYSDLTRLRQENIDWLPPLPTLSDLFAELQPLGTELFKNFFAFFSNSLAVILQLLLVLVLTFMMLANPQEYRRAFLKLFPSFYRRRADDILAQSEVALVNWLGGTLISCTGVGILSGIWLSILQIKLVLVHALLAGLLNLIPNIGPTASVIFPIMIALLDAPWKIAAILIGYFFIQQAESYFITPLVMAKQVSLLPAITLTAQIFFASFFGVLGLLLALPLAVVAKTWIEELLLKDILDRWDRHPLSVTEVTSILPSVHLPVEPRDREDDTAEK